MALTTRVWSAGKLLLLAGALFLTYVIFAVIGMRVALKTREITRAGAPTASPAAR